MRTNWRKVAGALAVGIGVVGAERTMRLSLTAESGGLLGASLVGSTVSGDFSEGAGLASIALLAKNGVRYVAAKSGGAAAKGHDHSEPGGLCELCILKEREALGV